MRCKGSKHIRLLISLPERTVNIISSTAQVFIASAKYCNTYLPSEDVDIQLSQNGSSGWHTVTSQALQSSQDIYWKCDDERSNM
jgi:hypothetical protein